LKFKPDAFDVLRGETVEFLLTNSSGFFHTFTIATSKDKGTVVADEQTSGPGERKTVRVPFPGTPGELYLFCRPHEIAGMIGTVNVK
jgi:plastocyanin